MTTYRDPPCEVCVAREEAIKAMLPFAEQRERACPACKSTDFALYQKVCSGKGNFLIQKGFWFFRWWNRVTFTCGKGPSPRHFHLVCRVCSHRWEMITALEGEGPK